MENEIIIGICEGQHDIAFLTRILKVNGFCKYDKRIEEFVKPLNGLFKKEYSRTKIEDKKLGYESNYKIPSVSLGKGNKIVLFHDMSGDKREAERKNVIEMYENLLGDDGFSSDNLKFKFLYFFDADDKGITEREKELKIETGTDIKHSKVILKGKFSYGCYIFHRNGHGSGELEDILIELMTNGNKDVFKLSKELVDSNPINENRRKDFVDEIYGKTIKFNEKKSIISVAGQMQFSGMSNGVIINKTDYIKKDDLLNNEQCKEIVKLFE